MVGQMASAIRAISEEIESNFGRRPKMVIVSIDPQEPSKIYIARKIAQAQKCNIEVERLEFTSSNTQQEIAQEIKKHANNPLVDGIIIQLPIPSKFNKQELISQIHPLKDIDGLTPTQQGRVANGQADSQTLPPPTAQGVLYLAQYICGSLVSKRVLNIGSSNLVGIPSALMFSHQGATVTIANSKTKNLQKICKNSQIIVSAAGVASLITPQMVSKNSVVIDVGINQPPAQETPKEGAPQPVLEKRRIVGDVDWIACSKITPYITPVPGGVGQFTIIFLLKNLVQAAILNTEEASPKTEENKKTIQKLKEDLLGNAFNPIWQRASH